MKHEKTAKNPHCCGKSINGWVQCVLPVKHIGFCCEFDYKKIMTESLKKKSKMKIVRPENYLCCNDGKPHIFLAGPTPRNAYIKSWRLEALEILKELKYEGIVSVPEPFLGNSERKDYIAQIKWEEKHLEMATCILFWVPRDIETLPGFTTNIEFGEWHKSGKVVFGHPEEAPKMQYLDYKAGKNSIPVYSTLRNTICSAV